MKHTLPTLPYAYNVLEPWIDAQTMEIHHTKHHQTYVDKLNAVLEKNPEVAEMKLEDLLKNLSTINLPDVDKKQIQNHGGGHVNHSFFWTLMDPANKPDSNLATKLKAEFGSVEEFKKKFTEVATMHFGSGWAWLVENGQGKLEVYSTPNQDSPYMKGHTPILGLDVWEHAYYLKYQNKRPDYIAAWWNLIKLV